MNAEQLIDEVERYAREVQRRSNSNSAEIRRARSKLQDARNALLAHIQAKDDEIAGLRLLTDYDND